MPQGPHRAAYRDRSMSNNTPPKVVGERAVLRGCCLGCRFYIISGTTLWCSLRLRWWWHVWRWHLWRSLVRRWSLVKRCIYVPRWRWLLHGWRLDSCHCIVRIHGKARLREWWLFRPGHLSPWWPVSIKRHRIDLWSLVAHLRSRSGIYLSQMEIISIQAPWWHNAMHLWVKLYM